MRFYFKTDYKQDLRLARFPAQWIWYGALLLALLVMPFLVGSYWVTQLTLILIFSLAGLGLMLLAGFTGLISLGHAGFLGVGAYTQAFLLTQGWPLLPSMVVAGLISAAVGVVVSLPSLRVAGMYLAIATLAFGMIMEEVFARWSSVTGGNAGMIVPPPEILGVSLASPDRFYWLCLVLTVAVTLLVRNLVRSSTGRAFIAIRDSEISAQSMGIHLARYKTVSFAVSAAIVGMAGALYAHAMHFISPEQFGIMSSIDLLLLVVIGGLGSLHGAFFGAAFIIAVPQLIAVVRDYLPAAIAQASGLQGLVFGLALIAIVLFEPMGMYGRWLKIRTYFELFPIYRKGMFKRQKAFQKSEQTR